MNYIANLADRSQYSTASTPDRDRPDVLFIVGDYPPKVCGIGDYTSHLSRELAAAGRRVMVLTGSSEGGQPCESHGSGVEVRRIIENWSWSEAGRILDVVDDLGERPVVHIQYGCRSTQRRPMVSLLPMYLRLRRPSCRVVLTLHEYRARRRRARIPTLPMILASHGVICVDPPDLEHLRRLCRLTHSASECIPIAPNILPVQMSDEQRRRWRQEMGFGDAESVILYFGNIEPLKGFPDLVAAVLTLRAEGLPLRLLIVGSFATNDAWFEPHLLRAREPLEQGIRDGWVVTLPKLPPEQVSHCFHAADVALLPYVRGARSNRGCLLTAVAHLLPVVTTEGTETPPELARGLGVVLAPAGNANALRERLREVVESEALRRQLRERMATARETFSWSTIALRTADFYCQLLAHTRIHEGTRAQ